MRMMNLIHSFSDVYQNNSHLNHFQKCGQFCYSFSTVLERGNSKAVSRGELEQSYKGNISRPKACFFIPKNRTTKETKALESTKQTRGHFLSMVERKEQRSIVGCFPCMSSFPPLYALPPYSGEPNKSYKDNAMYQFIFAGIHRTDLTNRIHKIRIIADSELSARAKLAREFILVLAGRIKLQNTAENDRTSTNTTATGPKLGLLNPENGGIIQSTTTKNGNRTRKTCGIFLPQNHTNNTARNGAMCSYIDFAVRLRDRTKAEFSRTNKIRRFFAVVDTLPPLMGDTLNTKQRATQMKTPQNLTALYAENSPILSTSQAMGCNMCNQEFEGRYSVILTYSDGTTFECAEGFSLKRAIQIKNQIKTAQAENDFSYRDVTAITITEKTAFNPQAEIKLEQIENQRMTQTGGNND